MAKITLPYKYNPRLYQRAQFEAYEKGIRRFVKIWHRRSGKDLTDLNFIACRMAERVGNYYHFFPTYAQGKKVIWQGRDKTGRAFLDYFPQELIRRRNETEMRIEYPNGSAYQIIGTEDINAVVGTNPVGLVLSEYALQNPFVWDYVRPIIKENDGWAIFNFTPRGENHAFELHQIAKDNPDTWFDQLLTVEDTRDEEGKRIITDADIEQERAEGMSEELIQQEYFCSFSSAISGAYYSKVIKELEEKHKIGHVPWDEMLPVSTFWDLGMDDTMFILFVQEDGYAYKIIDVVYDHGHGFEHYKKLLYDKPYKYAAHYVPHDARVRELSSGEERSKTLDALLREPVEVLPRPHSIQDKIEATRQFLRKVYIDKENCRYLINCLKNYRQDYSEGGKIWSEKPVHDWSSHGADAVAYLALHIRQGFNLGTTSVTPSGIVLPTINIKTFSEQERLRDPYSI